jgi:hypothetical protein
VTTDCGECQPLNLGIRRPGSGKDQVLFVSTFLVGSRLVAELCAKSEGAVNSGTRLQSAYFFPIVLSPG